MGLNRRLAFGIRQQDGPAEIDFGRRGAIPVVHRVHSVVDDGYVVNRRDSIFWRAFVVCSSSLAPASSAAQRDTDHTHNRDSVHPDLQESVSKMHVGCRLAQLPDPKKCDSKYRTGSPCHPRTSYFASNPLDDPSAELSLGLIPRRY